MLLLTSVVAYTNATIPTYIVITFDRISKTTLPLLILPVEAADQIGSGDRGYFSKVPRIILHGRVLTILSTTGSFIG